MYIGTFRRTNGFFAVPLRGLLSLAGPAPVLVKFEDIFIIFRCFRGYSMLFSSVLVKVHDSKHRLTQKIFKCTFTKTGKISIQKIVFSDFIHVSNSFFQSFCHKESKFADLFYLFTYIDYVSSFVSGSFRRTITYIKGLWNVPLQGPKYFLPQTFIF